MKRRRGGKQINNAGAKEIKGSYMEGRGEANKINSDGAKEQRVHAKLTTTYFLASRFFLFFSADLGMPAGSVWCEREEKKFVSVEFHALMTEHPPLHPVDDRRHTRPKQDLKKVCILQCAAPVFPLTARVRAKRANKREERDDGPNPHLHRGAA